jgi:hydrogenase maturation protease
VATRLSPHQVGVADLLDGARWLGRLPKQLVLLGLVPESMDLVVGLSPRVQSQLPALLERVVEEAHELGHVFRPKVAGSAKPGAGRALDVSRLAGMR